MKGNKFAPAIIATLALGFYSTSFAAASLSVPMKRIDANGQMAPIGEVRLADSKNGLMITPALHGLPAGLHGFHVHVNPNCTHAGEGAGGHLDPAKTNMHKGPYQNGHLGDLPALYVDKEGNASLPVLAPRLSVAKVKNHALMVHEGGDNYADQPEKLGGGGKRIACGEIS